MKPILLCAFLCTLTLFSAAQDKVKIKDTGFDEVDGFLNLQFKYLFCDDYGREIKKLSFHYDIYTDDRLLDGIGVSYRMEVDFGDEYYAALEGANQGFVTLNTLKNNYESFDIDQINPNSSSSNLDRTSIQVEFDFIVKHKYTEEILIKTKKTAWTITENTPWKDFVFLSYSDLTPEAKRSVTESDWTSYIDNQQIEIEAFRPGSDPGIKATFCGGCLESEVRMIRESKKVLSYYISHPETYRAPDYAKKLAKGDSLSPEEQRIVLNAYLDYEWVNRLLSRSRLKSTYISDINGYWSAESERYHELEIVWKVIGNAGVNFPSEIDKLNDLDKLRNVSIQNKEKTQSVISNIQIEQKKVYDKNIQTLSLEGLGDSQSGPLNFGTDLIIKESQAKFGIFNTQNNEWIIRDVGYIGDDFTKRKTLGVDTMFDIAIMFQPQGSIPQRYIFYIIYFNIEYNMFLPPKVSLEREVYNGGEHFPKEKRENEKWRYPTTIKRTSGNSHKFYKRNWIGGEDYNSYVGDWYYYRLLDVDLKERTIKYISEELKVGAGDGENGDKSYDAYHMEQPFDLVEFCNELNAKIKMGPSFQTKDFSPYYNINISKEECFIDGWGNPINQFYGIGSNKQREIKSKSQASNSPAVVNYQKAEEALANENYSETVEYVEKALRYNDSHGTAKLYMLGAEAELMRYNRTESYNYVKKYKEYIATNRNVDPVIIKEMEELEMEIFTSVDESIEEDFNRNSKDYWAYDFKDIINGGKTQTGRHEFNYDNVDYFVYDRNLYYFEFPNTIELKKLEESIPINIAESPLSDYESMFDGTVYVDRSENSQTRMGEAINSGGNCFVFDQGKISILYLDKNKGEYGEYVLGKPKKIEYGTVLKRKLFGLPNSIDYWEETYIELVDLRLYYKDYVYCLYFLTENLKKDHPFYYQYIYNKITSTADMSAFNGTISFNWMFLQELNKKKEKDVGYYLVKKQLIESIKGAYLDSIRVNEADYEFYPERLNVYMDNLDKKIQSFNPSEETVNSYNLSKPHLIIPDKFGLIMKLEDANSNRDGNKSIELYDEYMEQFSSSIQSLCEYYDLALAIYLGGDDYSRALDLVDKGLNNTEQAPTRAETMLLLELKSGLLSKLNKSEQAQLSLNLAKEIRDEYKFDYEFELLN